VLIILADADKQTAINLFLGVHEHHGQVSHPRGNYQQWYQPQNLATVYTVEGCFHALNDFVTWRGDFWSEYYRPLLFTSLGKHFAYCMNTLKPPGQVTPFIINPGFVLTRGLIGSPSMESATVLFCPVVLMLLTSPSQL
jgi:hypothetical protein